MNRWLGYQVIGVVCTCLLSAHGAAPRLLCDGVVLELVASAPEISTPIGMTMWNSELVVIESHTHQRPDDYSGPTSDRIRRFRDTNGDGQLDAWSTLADGFQQAMNLWPAPDGGLLVVTRRDVQRLAPAENRSGNAAQHTPGQTQAPGQTQVPGQTIVRLETQADYPHNGLSGIAISPDGVMYLGLGENFGEPYSLIGSDGSRHAGRGGWGAVYTCTPQGEQIRRFATGFWNPFSLCLAYGQLFTVDNDPDASPPCRLLQVIESGDYGHRFEYGRAGVHPLQAWDGELPGTLPMICGTGEAPTAIIAHAGYLWVTSWGDHRIERYALESRGGTYTARREVVVQGDHEFRPTGMCVAPDGTLYFADWVQRSYPVHGAGKVWQLKIAPSAHHPQTPSRRTNDQSSVAMWSDPDPFLRQQAIANQCRLGDDSLPPREALKSDNPRARLSWLQSLRWSIGHAAPAPEVIDQLATSLQDADRDVRLFALRWIADEKIVSLRDSVAQLLERQVPDDRYFLAVIAALDWLDAKEATRNSQIQDALLRRELANSQRSVDRQALALRMISPDHEWLTPERLRGFLASGSEPLQLQVARTLALQTSTQRLPLLREIALGTIPTTPYVRAQAVAGLAASTAADSSAVLDQLANDPEARVAQTAQTVQRLTAHQRVPDPGTPPADLAAWYQQIAAEPGDRLAGELLFFMPRAMQCVACHQVHGRGGLVGPELTHIGRQQTAEKILESILHPSREIAPRYQAWTLETVQGEVYHGLRLAKGGEHGEEAYVDSQGNRFLLASDQIETRHPAENSIMPHGLELQLSVADLRNLLAFLMAPSP